MFDFQLNPPKVHSTSNILTKPFFFNCFHVLQQFCFHFQFGMEVMGGLFFASSVFKKHYKLLLLIDYYMHKNFGLRKISQIFFSWPPKHQTHMRKITSTCFGQSLRKSQAKDVVKFMKRKMTDNR